MQRLDRTKPLRYALSPCLVCTVSSFFIMLYNVPACLLLVLYAPRRYAASWRLICTA
jgi:hypothetical protein